MPESPACRKDEVPTSHGSGGHAARSASRTRASSSSTPTCLRLAYREDNSNVDASAAPLPLDVMAEPPMRPTARARARRMPGDDHGYYHMDMEPVGDARARRRKHGRFQPARTLEIKEDEDAPNAVAVARASGKR